jgi:hypothetical protein
MTDALCFFCGNVKFGALVPCPKCGQPSPDDMQLNITFSDHYMARSTLEQFGEVIRAINDAEPDPGARFWTFMHYVSTEHPDIMRVELHGPAAQEIPAKLARLTLPSVEKKPGRRQIDWDEARETAGKKPSWWQFWRR